MAVTNRFQKFKVGTRNAQLVTLRTSRVKAVRPVPGVMRRGLPERRSGRRLRIAGARIVITGMLQSRPNLARNATHRSPRSLCSKDTGVLAVTTHIKHLSRGTKPVPSATGPRPPPRSNLPAPTPIAKGAMNPTQTSYPRARTATNLDPAFMRPKATRNVLVATNLTRLRCKGAINA